MIRVLIVDDEPPARRKVRRFLERDAAIGDIREAASGGEAIAAIRGSTPDIVFLDVQMPDMDGFAALSAVRDAGDFHVVFLTAHEQHAIRAFEAEALDYLLKPVDPDRFEQALERAKTQIALRRSRQAPGERRGFAKRVLVQKKGREVFLPIERIDWADAEGNYLHLHAGAETYLVRSTLDLFARQLDPDQFVRINRSQLVNLDRVKEMQPWFHGERRVILTDGRALTWTRRFRASLRAASSRR